MFPSKQSNDMPPGPAKKPGLTVAIGLGKPKDSGALPDEGPEDAAEGKPGLGEEAAESPTGSLDQIAGQYGLSPQEGEEFLHAAVALMLKGLSKGGV